MGAKSQFRHNKLEVIKIAFNDPRDFESKKRTARKKNIRAILCLSSDVASQRFQLVSFLFSSNICKCILKIVKFNECILSLQEKKKIGSL